LPTARRATSTTSRYFKEPGETDLRKAAFTLSKIAGYSIEDFALSVEYAMKNGFDSDPPEPQIGFFGPSSQLFYMKFHSLPKRLIF
jgi:hypothetical protein